jgi:hypothetical protein
MPRALEPGATFDVVLDCDKDKPKETRPTFVYGALTGRQWRSIAELWDKLDTTTGAVESCQLLFDAARTNLKGWRNMVNPVSGNAFPFDPKELDQIIDVAEAHEIIGHLRSNGRLSLDDQKKSE